MRTTAEMRLVTAIYGPVVTVALAVLHWGCGGIRSRKSRQTG